MSPLPTEIWLSICSLLETTEDVKSFRLISSICAAVGLEYLIPQATIVVRNSSLTRLEAISTHPVLSKRLKVFRLLVDIAPPYPSVGMWKKYTRVVKAPSNDTQAQNNGRKLSLRSGPSSRSTPDASVTSRKYSSKGWTHYQKLVKEQKALLTSNKLSDTLEACLTKLPNLEDILIGSLLDVFGSAIAEEAFFRINPKDHSYSVNTFYDYGSSIDLCIRLLPVLFRCIRVSSFILQELMITTFDWRLFSPGIDPSELEFALRGLLILDFNCMTYPTTAHTAKTPSHVDLVMHDMNTSSLAICVENLRIFLSQAKRLLVLSVDFSSLGGPWDVNTSSFLDGTTLARLRILDLAEVTISGGDFLTFLENRDGILRCLRLRTVCLEDDSIVSDWPSFFQMMNETITLESTAFLGDFYSTLWPPLSLERPLILLPDVPVGRAIRYLTCHQTTDEWDREDKLTKSQVNWDSIDFGDIEDGYSDDED